jgi:hypothetical protein
LEEWCYYVTQLLSSQTDKFCAITLDSQQSNKKASNKFATKVEIKIKTKIEEILHEAVATSGGKEASKLRNLGKEAKRHLQKRSASGQVRIRTPVTVQCASSPDQKRALAVCYAF